MKRKSAAYKTLSSKDIAKLLKIHRAGYGQVYRDAAELAKFMQNKPYFLGTKYDWSVAIGIPERRLNAILNWSRSVWWMDTFGWTIPWVGRGPGVRKWRIASAGPADSKILYDSTIGERRISAVKLQKEARMLKLAAQFCDDAQERGEINLAATHIEHALAILQPATTP